MNLRHTWLWSISFVLGATWSVGCSSGPQDGSSSVGASSTGGDGIGGRSTGGRSGEGTGGRSTGGGGGDGSGGSSSEGRCTDPVPLDSERDTGTFTCAEGYLHRERAVACRYTLPRSGVTEWPFEGQGGAGGESNLPDLTEINEDLCSRDSDCGNDEACTVSGFCKIGPDTSQWDFGFPCSSSWIRVLSRSCTKGCEVDADCGPRSACICGEEFGTCVPLDAEDGCRSDQDCESGFYCVRTTSYPRGDTTVKMRCQRADDECFTHGDCGSLQQYCDSDGACQTAAIP
jgi:hypothetical protein